MSNKEFVLQLTLKAMEEGYIVRHQSNDKNLTEIQNFYEEILKTVNSTK